MIALSVNDPTLLAFFQSLYSFGLYIRSFLEGRQRIEATFNNFLLHPNELIVQKVPDSMEPKLVPCYPEQFKFH
jgi:hypothetical protein